MKKDTKYDKRFQFFTTSKRILKMVWAISGFSTHNALIPEAVGPKNLAKQTKKFPQPKAHPQKPFHIFLKKTIRFLRGEKNILVEEIKKLAKGQGVVENKNKIPKVIEAIQSIDYRHLKNDLRKIIAKMTDQEREQLLTTALEKDFKQEQKFLGNQCIQLMTLSNMRSLAKLFNEKFIDVQTTAHAFNAIVQSIKKYDINEVHKKLLINSKQFILFRFIRSLIQTIGAALNLLQLGKEPNTFFETKYMLDIYWKLIEIPFAITKFIFNTIVNPLISLAVVIAGAVISTVAIHIFSKWFKRCPDDLPYCRNLTAEVKNGTVKPIFGREHELDEILQSLAANNDMGRKHPLLIGKPGIGKTELMKGLAWRLSKGTVPKTLKGKKLFYINGGELAKNVSPFDLKDPLEKIMHKIEGQEKELIIVFDEIHALIDKLGERFNTILDTTPHSLFYAIGITNLKPYEDKIETTSLDRRFKKIKIEEATEKQTRTILQSMVQQQAPEMKTAKKIFNFIYSKTNEKITKRCQPDKAILVLSQAIEKIRHLQYGGSFETELNELSSKKEQLVSRLARKKLHGISINSDKIQNMVQQLNENHKKIEETVQKIAKKKLNAETFVKLKKLRTWHENWLYDMSEKILQNGLKGNKPTAVMEKIYLFNSFILIPHLDSYLDEFAKRKNLKNEIDETMVTDIINRLAKQEMVVEAVV